MRKRAASRSCRSSDRTCPLSRNGVQRYRKSGISGMTKQLHHLDFAWAAGQCTIPVIAARPTAERSSFTRSEPSSEKKAATNNEALQFSNVRCEFLYKICGILCTTILPSEFCNRLRCLAACRVAQHPTNSSAEFIRIGGLLSVRASRR